MSSLVGFINYGFLFLVKNDVTDVMVINVSFNVQKTDNVGKNYKIILTQTGTGIAQSVQ
jgi:hypothetical protein